MGQQTPNFYFYIYIPALLRNTSLVHEINTAHLTQIHNIQTPIYLLYCTAFHTVQVLHGMNHDQEHYYALVITNLFYSLCPTHSLQGLDATRHCKCLIKH
jgi:hypothetical protein